MKKIFVIILFILVITTACAKPLVTDTPETTPPATEAVKEVSPTEETPKDTSETVKEEEPFYLDDFELTALDGTKTSLYAYEGKTIVLNFWATWCGYCVREMPLLNTLNEREDYVVLAVNTGEDSETVKKYIEENGYTFDVFLDEKSELASAFYVSGLPTSLFIGPDFEYYFSYPGAIDEELLERMIADIEKLQKKD